MRAPKGPRYTGLGVILAESLEFGRETILTFVAMPGERSRTTSSALFVRSFACETLLRLFDLRVGLDDAALYELRLHFGLLAGNQVHFGLKSAVAR